MHTVFRKKAADPFGDTAQLRGGYIGKTAARLPWRDHGQTVGLVQLGGKLGGGLVAADAHRAVQSGDLEHLLFRQPGDACRGTVQALAAGDIEKGLVHREHLHVGADRLQPCHDHGGNFGIDAGAGRAFYQLRAEFERLFHTHAGLDAEGSCLIGAGDNGAAQVTVGDGDGAAAQLGKVTLLHAGEKGVHVDQQDGARPVDGTDELLHGGS